MPTILALDVSLSMSRPVKTDSSDDFSRKNLAIHGLSTLLDHFTSHCKLEFTSLVRSVLCSLDLCLINFRNYNWCKDLVFNKLCKDLNHQNMVGLVPGDLQTFKTGGESQQPLVPKLEKRHWDDTFTGHVMFHLTKISLCTCSYLQYFCTGNGACHLKVDINVNLENSQKIVIIKQ